GYIHLAGLQTAGDLDFAFALKSGNHGTALQAVGVIGGLHEHERLLVVGDHGGGRRHHARLALGGERHLHEGVGPQHALVVGPADPHIDHPANRIDDLADVLDVPR